MQVTLAPGLTGSLAPDGSPVSVAATVPGQRAYYTFTASAGQSLGLGITNLALTPASAGYVVVYVKRPDGSYLSSTFYCYLSDLPGCQRVLRNLPLTGTYTVEIVPGAYATMSATLTLSQSVTGTLSPGVPLNLNLASPGQNAVLTFTASTGQTFALNVGSLGMTPANAQVYVYVYNPAGAQVAFNNTSSGTTLNLSNLSAGTYTVVFVPYNAATGTMQVTLAAGMTGSLPTDGSSTGIAATVPGQNGYFTFSGTAGQNLGLGLTGLSLNPTSSSLVTMTVKKPDGSAFGSATYCYTSYVPGCQSALRSLPTTGTYTVELVPSGHAALSATLTLSQSIGGALTLGASLPITLASPGQNAVLTFTASAGQSRTLTIFGIATTPASGQVYVYVHNPSGSQVAFNSGATSVALNLTNLVTGTYSVLIVPYYAHTGTMQATLQ
jgi:hypothetical protein